MPGQAPQSVTTDTPRGQSAYTDSERTTQPAGRQLTSPSPEAEALAATAWAQLIAHYLAEHRDAMVVEDASDGDASDGDAGEGGDQEPAREGGGGGGRRPARGRGDLRIQDGEGVLDDSPAGDLARKPGERLCVSRPAGSSCGSACRRPGRERGGAVCVRVRPGDRRYSAASAWCRSLPRRSPGRRRRGRRRS